MREKDTCTVIGLTGPSGAGKGFVVKLLAGYGFPSIDADDVYHRMLEEAGPCTRELAKTFGETILNENGLVERKKLAAIVFGTPDSAERLHTLNAITHKYIMANIRDDVRRYKSEGARAILLDAPLLFEAGADRDCDLTIALTAPEALRVARIVKRDGISREAALQRVRAGKSDDFYAERATYLLQNTDDDERLEAELCQILIRHGVIRD